MQIGIPLSLTRLNNGNGTGGETPVRLISVQNRGYSAQGTAGSFDRYLVRYQHRVATNSKTMMLATMGWVMGETNMANAYTYQAVSIEHPNGTVAPVYWGGVRNKTINPGDNDVVSDPLLPADFGVSQFNRGDVYWVKLIMTLPSAGNNIPYNSFVYVGDVATAQSAFYNNADTTPSSVDAPGVFTVTGTALSGIINVHLPYMLGNPVVDGESYLGIGDSILLGFGDQISQGVNGRGYQQRGMHDGIATGYANPVPSMQFCNLGIGTSSFTGGNTKWVVWQKYARYGLSEISTANVNNGDSAATIQGNLTTIWNAMRTNGAEKIIKTEYFTNATSTDDWATQGNQTVTAAYQSGGIARTVDTWAAANADAVVPTTDVIVPATYKWVTNNTPFRMNFDAIHLYTTGSQSIGDETAAINLRATRASL